VCSARCLSAPIGQAGKGTCEERMTPRNWRLVSHGVGQSSRHPPRGCMGGMRSRKAECTAVIGRRGAERRMAESPHRLNLFFFLWLFEKFISTTWKPEFGELMRCCGGDRGLGETMCHFGICFLYLGSAPMLRGWSGRRVCCGVHIACHNPPLEVYSEIRARAVLRYNACS
jgi:hypothetical protein